jgi:flagellar hook-basal body complex protein FliE
MDRIQEVNPLQSHLLVSERQTAPGKDNGDSFAGFLDSSIQSVNQKQAEANQAIQDLATGSGGSIHDTMIAMEKASISFELMVQVRNKIVSAYQEIMRMPV